ncbi:MAG: response regulator transcription factor [Peptococcaceae bacterium]|nr:response regulator transcription factor [Peptococcaceae bacterium]
MQKIYIVEDDNNIRELVVYALNSAGYEVTGFESGEEFFPAITKEPPELVLLDIMLPGEDGLSILARLAQHKPARDIPVIMLTAKSSEYDRIKGLDLGADDYIVKPFSVLELISRVKAVLRRYNANNLGRGDQLVYKNIRMDTKKHDVSIDGVSLNLTFKEFELLHLLLINKGIVLSREKIMNQVWGMDFEGESRTVDMHIKSIRQKLGASGKFIKTIRSVGYKLGE